MLADEGTLAWVPDIRKGSPKSSDDQSGLAWRAQAHFRACALVSKTPWKCWSVCLLRFLWGHPDHVPTCHTGEGAQRGLRTPSFATRGPALDRHGGQAAEGASLLTKQTRRRRETWQRLSGHRRGDCMEGVGVNGLRSQPGASPFTLLLTTGQLRGAGKGRPWRETCECPQFGGNGGPLPTMSTSALPEVGG